MAHLHVTAWVVAIILLFVVVSLYKNDNQKTGKILHMILRLDYLVILFSGIMLFTQYSSYDGYLSELIIKMLAGLWAIVSIEMITVRTNKDQAHKSWWIQFIVALLIAIILGFGRLPFGVLP